MTTSAPANAGLTDRVLTYLAAHPGDGFRPSEVARAVMPDEPRQRATITVGNCLVKLAKRGRVSVARTTVPGKVRPVPSYQHLDAPPTT